MAGEWEQRKQVEELELNHTEQTSDSNEILCRKVSIHINSTFVLYIH